MIKIERCPCEECEHSAWCILEQTKYDEKNPENPINWCSIYKNWTPRQEI